MRLQPGLFRAEENRAQGRQGHVHGMGVAMHGDRLGLDAADVAEVLAAVVPGIRIEHLRVASRPGHAHPVVVHGLGRNATGYFAALQRARAAAGVPALLIAPHFLATTDAGGDDLLRWRSGDWMGGLPARGPVPVSAFDVLDALLARLSDRTRFPALTDIVLIGHSAGAQLVQRYAAVGHGAGAGLHVRYVVANPSSYLWFSPDRPDANGQPAAFAGAAACPTYNHWKFGLAGGLPPYVKDDPATLEVRYVGREIVYLLGAEDIDPHQRDLDRSCGGEAQGPYRLARGHAFQAMLQARHGALATQIVHEVPGVAHAGAGMLNSACGVAAMFDTPGCD